MISRPPLSHTQIEEFKAEGGAVEAGGGWDDVDDEMRRHPRYDAPSDLFKYWGAAVSGAGAARMR